MEPDSSGQPERMAAFSYLKDARVLELAIKLADASSIRLSGVHSVKALLLVKHVI